MKRLRTISTRRLLIVVGVIALLGVSAGIAQGALSNSNPTPAAKPLNQAVVDAVNAPKVDGLTASVTFTNNLIAAGSLPEGSTSPLLAGAKGRLWVTNDGRFRVELQSDAGDAQIVSDGKQVTVYDANSNTAYRFDAPQGGGKDGGQADANHQPVTLDQVDKAINQISQHWSLSGANPTSTAGAPTYTVRISPKDDGGLLGAAELAWDADNGIPLRAAVYADNQSSPVLELKADDVSFNPVSDSDVNVSPPSGARVVDMSSRQPQGQDQSGQPQKIEGVDAVQSKLDFKLVAPDALAGLPRQNVRLVQHENSAGAVAVYGKGLGAIVVLQNKAGAKQNQPLGGGGGGGDHSLRLPQVNINGATGTELATALGTVVTFERNGISYTVAGSVPPQAAEQAARELQ
jgi:outer membrane lipoprotein-sorting protein